MTSEKIEDGPSTNYNVSEVVPLITTLNQTQLTQSQNDIFKAEYKSIKTEIDALQQLDPNAFKSAKQSTTNWIDTNLLNKATPREVFHEIIQDLDITLFKEEDIDEILSQQPRNDVIELTNWLKNFDFAPVSEIEDSFAKLGFHWLRIKLFAKYLPLKRVYKIRKPPSHWKSAMNALKFVRFIEVQWHKPLDELQRQEMQQRAKQIGSELINVTFIRHGQSTANAAWNEGQHAELGIFDAKLTDLGIQQCKERAKELEEIHYVPQVIICSPLSRALQTTLNVFGDDVGKKIPVIAHPACREMLTASDDVGRLKHQLAEDFPQIDLSLVPDSFWWFIPEGLKVQNESLQDHRTRFLENPWKEPIPVVLDRVKEFEVYLAGRTETNIAVVSHGDFLRGMTGKTKLGNCDKYVMEVKRLQK